jgi:hypothetical protein
VITWLMHKMGLKTPKEMRQMEQQFLRDSRLFELQLAYAMSATLDEERGNRLRGEIAAKAQKEGYTLGEVMQ